LRAREVAHLVNRHLAWALVALAMLLGAGCGGGAEKLQEQVAKGKALLAEDKYDAAAAELVKATEMDKNSMQAWLQLGHAYRGLKRTDDALAAYVAAKKIDRHSVAPHVAHAKVQIELGRVELATTELNFVVEMDPKNLEALILLGRVSQMPHKLPDGTTGVSKASLERAELNLEAATTLAPQNVEAKFELAKLYAKLDKREQAVAALKQLQSLAETDPAAKKLAPEIAQALKGLEA
jgi:Flp pilus assembly protein TadD